MITQEQFDQEVKAIIANAIREDVGDGDHSSLACIPENARGRAKLLVKDKGIIGGVNFAKKVFAYVDKNLKLEVLIEDGSEVTYGDVVMYIEGPSQSILKAERTVLNAMQRMSAIATKTRMFVDLLDKHVIYFCGNGAEKCKTMITHANARFLSDIHPLASHMIHLAEQAYEAHKFEDVAYFEPFYLKEFQATVAKKSIINS